MSCLPLVIVMTLRFATEQDFGAFLGKRAGRGANKRAAKPKQAVQVSPHALALAKLSKKPELIKGKQEHYLQVQVFDYFERYHPEVYEYMSAYPAGGMRSAKVGSEMKAEGQVSGYPDIMLDIPAGVYHGARFELKTDVGTLQVTQKTTLKKLSGQGYYCTARKGFDDMVKAILDYTKLKAGETLEHGQFDKKWLDYQSDN